MKHITNGKCKVLPRVTRKLNKVAGGDTRRPCQSHFWKVIWLFRFC